VPLLLAPTLRIIGMALVVLLLGAPATAQDAPAQWATEATCDVLAARSAHVIECLVRGIPEGVALQMVVQPRSAGDRTEWSGSATSSGEATVVEATVGCDVTGPADVTVMALIGDGSFLHRDLVVLPDGCATGLTTGQWLRLTAVALLAVGLAVVPRTALRRMSAHRRRGARVSGAGSGRSGAAARRQAPRRSRRTPTRRR
jgi:hypothetical protein